MKSSTHDSIGKIPIGLNPMNQTTNVGKNPKGSNPLKIPWNSFESKEPLLKTHNVLSCGMSGSYLVLLTFLMLLFHVYSASFFKQFILLRFV